MYRFNNHLVQWILLANSSICVYYSHITKVTHFFVLTVLFVYFSVSLFLDTLQIHEILEVTHGLGFQSKAKQQETKSTVAQIDFLKDNSFFF